MSQCATILLFFDGTLAIYWRPGNERGLFIRPWITLLFNVISQEHYPIGLMSYYLDIVTRKVSAIYECECQSPSGYRWLDKTD